MKNRAITITLVAIVLMFFVGYFGIKEMALKDMNLNEKIDRVENYAKKGEWEQAHLVAKEVQKDWKKYDLLININYAESEHSLFDESVESLVAGSEAKDLPTILTNAKTAKGFWKNLNKIVPGP
ncbi:DUF4363 family protein [Lentibacillus cibarius]|nr:DUF4363 family protein [Lentibacillus cibarius]